MKLLRRGWDKRPLRIVDQESQLFPLDCDAPWVPPRFWRFCMFVDPYIGFWPYQVLAFDHFFKCWYMRQDGTQKQSRQTGKSTMIPLPISYLICDDDTRAQVIVCSAAMNKIHKITRPIIHIMKKTGMERYPDAAGETRFAATGAGFKNVSGKDDAFKDGETSHVLLVDEAQDVNFQPVYAQISPFRDGVDGIMFAMGRGGIPDSMLEKMEDQPDTLNLNIIDEQIVKQRPRYQKAMDRGKREFLDWEYAAHYRGERIQLKGAVLIPRLPEWGELFPNTKFHYDQCEPGSIELLFDFAGRVDSTCGIAIGKVGDMTVLFDFVRFAPGENFDTQICGLAEWIVDTPFDNLRPEVNNLGDLFVHNVKSKIADILRERKMKSLDKTRWHPVTANEFNIHEACRLIYKASIAGNLVYVNDHKNPHTMSCIKDLKGIGIRYTPKRKIKFANHSDWGAALRAGFTTKKIARLVA